MVYADSMGSAERWRDNLQRTLPLHTAYLKVNPPQRGQAFAPPEPLWGEPREVVEIVENGVRYEIRVAIGLSVGLFLDMREVRAWIREQAHGKRVLNLFAYTCAFGVCAMLGGAERGLNLDLSKSYLEWGRANYALNGLAAEARDFVYGDALDWLTRFGRRGEQFDLVIVDPPSFSTSRTAAFSVERDYARLATLAAQVVAPAGMLLAATNHAGTSDQRFDGWLEAALTAAERRSRLVRRWHEPQPDFPVPRGRRPYLKVRAIELT
ncbi:MAG: class I SAM-dependent rRNA methyltransferase [Chloroflexi bacterium]|nr:class I SAM-dependent rRNA methyltransferase [Chloroflexota bacterium]